MKKKCAEKKRQTNRQYKNNLFVYLFTRKKEYALSLYNAVNNTNYTNAEELKLSDAFFVPDKTGGFEWTATVLNINPGYNEALFAKCEILWEYTQFVEKVKEKMKYMNADSAMKEAVRESIYEGILMDFFKEYGEEIVSMAWFEIDQVMMEEIQREEALEDARVEGRALGLEEGRAEAEKTIFLLKQENDKKNRELLLLKQEIETLRKQLVLQ